MQISTKYSRNRTGVIGFMRILLIVLLIMCHSIKIFAANSIFEEERTIQYEPDNGLFHDLLQADDRSPDIARISLRLAKQEYPDINVEDYVECVDWYARVLEARIQEGEEPESKIKIINEFLFDELGFVYVQTVNPEDLLLNKVIDRRKGNCIGLSILYLSIAERLRLPLFGVNVPEHIFVRYDDGKQIINIETGHKGMSLSDSFYVTHSIERFDKRSVENGSYLQNLNKKEVVSNILLDRSKIRREGGDHERALEDCEKAILLNPKNPGAYCNMGVIYEKMGKISEAIENYGTAISLNHKYASAYYNRGSLLGMAGRYDMAIEDFSEAIAINPRFTLSYLNRAVALKKMGKLEEAMQDYDNIINIDPHYAQAFCNRGVIFAETGRLDDALNDFNKAIELDPELSDAYFARAIFFADNKRLQDAIEDFGRCISLSPDKIFAYYLRGKMYQKSGQIDKAIQDFNKAITVRPSMAGLYIDRGTLLLQAGRIDEAIVDFNKSIELFPGNPIAYRYRGEAFKVKGQYEKAGVDFEMFLKMVPDAPDAGIIRNEIQEMKYPFVKKNVP